MKYQKYRPDPQYAEWVECYFIWEGEAIPETQIESPPNSFCSIVYNYGNPYQVSTHRNPNAQVPQFFICGQATHSYTLHLKGQIGMIGAVLKPTALYQILEVDISSLTGERVEALPFISQKHLTEIHKLNLNNTQEEKVAAMRHLIQRLLQKPLSATQAIVRAANQIVDSNGQADIPDLIEQSFMSRRKFERLFLQQVGVSPKAYAKIRRFSQACKIMASQKEVVFTDLLHQVGYYDQSHFIRDCKYFTGRAPRFYKKNNKELVKLLQPR